MKQKREPFQRKNAENVLDGAAAHTSEQVGTENVLELADALCLLANVEPPRPVKMSEAEHQAKRRQGMARACDFLKKPEWKDRLDQLASYSRLTDEQLAELDFHNELDHEKFRAGRTLEQCARLATPLAHLILTGQCFVDRHEMFHSHMEAATGRVITEQMSLLGPYQDILWRTLNHPKVDARRFKLCAACTGFFYQHRDSSRACCRKCVNVLMAREHYERKRRAIELKRNGKHIFQIAAALGVTSTQARRYLRT